MTNLLDRAEDWMETAEEAFNKSSGEDSKMDKATFMLHQSLEFVLKYIIEQTSGQYSKGHDITLIITEAQSVGIQRTELSALLPYAHTVTSWEASARYGSGIKTTRVLFEAVMKETKSLIAYAKTMNSSALQSLINAANQSGTP